MQRWLREQRPDMLQMLGETTAAPARAPLDLSSLPPAVVVSHLTWSYKAGGATVLPDLSFTIPRGCRCLPLQVIRALMTLSCCPRELQLPCARPCLPCSSSHACGV